ncbi:MAG: two-component sensor histidine kinase, partial [Desulfomonile sp.]|nr:two-component sensor histidine kinase [Desulfomonile sp.]
RGFRSIVFEQELDSGLPQIETEPEKLRQVMINLIFNAADAVGEAGGTILLRTRALDKGIEIQVQDSGRGIPKEYLDKVFDPFFTTKEPGDGTGLGLSVCLAIVESLGGEIDIKSTEGKGTVVTVRLPG